MEKRHLALLALLACYAAIHLLVLNNKPFFGDEIWFAKLARGIMESGFPKPDMMVHPPAFGYMLAASFRLFGFSEASARLLPMLFGLLSLVVVYKMGSSLSRGVGLLAVFILVISKIFNSYTTLVDMDGSVVVFFLLLEIYLMLKYLGGEKAGLLRAAAVLGIGLMFKLGTLAVPFVALAAIDRKNAAKGLLAGLGLFAVIYAAYFVIFYPQEQLKSGIAYPFVHFLSSATAVRESLWKFLGVFFWNSSFPLVALSGYSLVRAVISGKERKLRFLAWCALLIIAAYSLTSHKMERYFVPAVPIAAILAANYLHPVIKRSIRLVGAAAVAGFLYFSLLGTYSLSPVNVALSILPLAVAALVCKNDAGKFLVAAFGLYVGLSVFTASVYATHDYVINECEGQREAASFIAKNLDEGEVAYTDATVGFYLGGQDYSNPVPDLEGGIISGRIKYYAQCKAWPNFSKKNVLDDIAEKYESGAFYVKSIKISEFG